MHYGFILSISIDVLIAGPARPSGMHAELLSGDFRPKPSFRERPVNKFAEEQCASFVPSSDLRRSYASRLNQIGRGADPRFPRGLRIAPSSVAAAECCPPHNGVPLRTPTKVTSHPRQRDSHSLAEPVLRGACPETAAGTPDTASPSHTSRTPTRAPTPA